MTLAKALDLTLLQPSAVAKQFHELVDNALKHGCRGVCVPPYWVAGLRPLLPASAGVKLVTVIGFPLGYSTSAAKLAELKQAKADGADEVDIVVNFTALLNGDLDTVKHEIEMLAHNAKLFSLYTKLIVESAYLSEEQLLWLLKLAEQAKIDCIKTSTGYAHQGANVETVALIRKHLPSTMQIKASGGIKTKEQALELMKAGADIVGASSIGLILE